MLSSILKSKGLIKKRKKKKVFLSLKGGCVTILYVVLVGSFHRDIAIPYQKQDSTFRWFTYQKTKTFRLDAVYII